MRTLCCYCFVLIWFFAVFFFLSLVWQYIDSRFPNLLPRWVYDPETKLTFSTCTYPTPPPFFNPAKQSQIKLSISRHWIFWGPLSLTRSHFFPWRVTVQKAASHTKQLSYSYSRPRNADLIFKINGANRAESIVQNRLTLQALKYSPSWALAKNTL